MHHDDEDRLPLFVYGTLRAGQGNYRRLLAGRTVGEYPAWLDGYAMFGRGVPYIRPEQGATVTGELMVVDDGCYEQTLAAVDALEGYRPQAPQAGAYRRVAETVTYQPEPGVEQATTAWVYVAGQAAAAAIRTRRRIPSGDWTDRARATPAGTGR